MHNDRPRSFSIWKSMSISLSSCHWYKAGTCTLFHLSVVAEQCITFCYSSGPCVKPVTPISSHADSSCKAILHPLLPVPLEHIFFRHIQLSQTYLIAIAHTNIRHVNSEHIAPASYFRFYIFLPIQCLMMLYSQTH